MKYLINLCAIFALFYGECGAMARGRSNDICWVKWGNCSGKSEIRKDDLFRDLSSAMDNHHNDLVKVLAKEACHNRFRGWSEEEKSALLFYAVENNLEEIIEDCADSRFNLNARGCFGKTPLLLAAERSYNSIAEYLLTSGADPNATDIRTGFSALMFASWRGNESLVRILIRNKTNVNALSYLGCSPLSLAMGNNHREIIKILKRAGADVCLENQNGDTLISMAQYYEWKSIENSREATRWNTIIRILKKEESELQEETIVIRQSFPSSIRSFFRSFFRK